MTDQVPHYRPENRAAWRKWLRANHATSKGVWLVFLKGEERQITYTDAVEEGLCFGWIDSLMRSVDERSYIQLFTPRKPKSKWSGLNKRRAEDLIKRKLMAAPGLAKIEAAKKDGSWSAHDAVEAMIVPADLARALARNTKASTFFETCAPSSRKGMLYYVAGVKSPDLRAQRIAHVVTQCAKRLRPAHQEAWLAKTRKTKPAKIRGR